MPEAMCAINALSLHLTLLTHLGMPDIFSVLMPFANLLEGVPASLAAVRALHSGSSIEVSPSPAATSAYLAFEKGGVEMLFHVQLIAGIGLPPSIKGGLWSYPAVYRSHRAMVEAMSTLTVAFGQMVVFGTDQACGAGAKFSEVLAEATQSMKIVNRRLQSTPAFEAKIRLAQEALRDFLLTVRSELGDPGNGHGDDQNQGGPPAKD